MEYGLALTGGDTKGITHVGVLRVLEEAWMLPPAVVGTDASSTMAGPYASEMPVSEMEGVVKHLSKHGNGYLDPGYARLLGFMPQLLAGMNVGPPGLIRGRKLLAYFSELTGRKQLDEFIVRLMIPAVDPVSGRALCFTSTDEVKDRESLRWVWNGYLYEVMTTSSSIPTAFSPLEMGNYRLVDGGTTNSLPENLLQEAGIQTVMSVDIGERYCALSDDSILEAATHSFSIVGERLKVCGSSSGILLFKPPLPGEAGLLTFDQMMACMETRYQYMRKMIPEIRVYLFERS